MGDRPLGRSLVRIGALALGRGRSHRQDLWPHLTIDGGRAGWRGQPLLTLTPLAKIVPERLPLIAIIGTGPSLRVQHPERLPPLSAILLNGAASLAARIENPLAVMVEDERFVFRHHAMLQALPPGLPLLASPAALRALAERGLGVLQDRPVGLIDNLAKPVNAARRALSDPSLDPMVIREGSAALSVDPQAGVVITGTVATTALQLALAARPGEVLLAGIDLGNAASPRFYEAAGSTAPSGLAKGMPRILGAFTLAARIAAQRGIPLGCASPVSLLLGCGYRRDDRLD